MCGSHFQGGKYLHHRNSLELRYCLLSAPDAQSRRLSRAKLRAKLRAKSKMTRDFLSGFIVNSSSPALLAYWMTLIGLTGANFGFKTHSSCDVVKCIVFSRITLRLNPLSLSWVNRVAGSALIVAAAGIVIRSFVF